MSLRVWLPMNRDLRNQGLDDVTVTNNGATFNSAGKLGGCYSFSGSSQKIINTLPSTIASSVGSLSCWIKMNSLPGSSSFYNLLQLGNLGGYATCRLGLYMEYTNYINISIDGSSTGSNRYTHSMIANQWYHICVTYDGIIVKLYIDGNEVLSKTASKGSYTTAASNLYIGGTSSYYLNGYINDARYYDHCLSPMEVKELAKGLVLHYPLNRQGWGQENLLSRYVVPGQAAPTSTAAGGRTTWLGDYKITIPATENADTYFRLFTTKQLTANATYTISCQVSGLKDGSYYRFPLYAQGNTGMGVLQLDHNGLCSLTFTMTYGTQTAATGANGETVYICFMDDSARSLASGQGAITVSNFKLEEGSVATPWCPNSADALATTMGLNSTIEYDCSGFCNNGIWHGTHTNTSDAPKYAVSTTATGSGTTYLEGPVLPAEAKTVALWIKNTSKSSNGAIFNDKTSGLQIGLLNSLLYMNSAASTAGFTTTHWVNGEWNHVVAVNNNGTRSLYVNGQAETQSGASNYYIHNADNCWLWNRSYNNNYPFTGSLCDLRVYTTALSADDVKSLYQNCATIDTDGTIRGQIRS